MIERFFQYIKLLSEVPSDYFNAVMFFGFFYYLFLFNIPRICFFLMKLSRWISEYTYYLCKLCKTKLKSILRKDDNNETD